MLADVQCRDGIRAHAYNSWLLRVPGSALVCQLRRQTTDKYFDRHWFALCSDLYALLVPYESTVERTYSFNLQATCGRFAAHDSCIIVCMLQHKSIKHCVRRIGQPLTRSPCCTSAQTAQPHTRFVFWPTAVLSLYFHAVANKCCTCMSSA